MPKRNNIEYYFPELEKYSGRSVSVVLSREANLPKLAESLAPVTMNLFLSPRQRPPL